MYYLSNSILIRNIFFHVILGKKHILVHDDIFSKESGKRVPKMCHRTQKKHYRKQKFGIMHYSLMAVFGNKNVHSAVDRNKNN